MLIDEPSPGRDEAGRDETDRDETDRGRPGFGRLGNLDVMTVVETDDGTIAFTDTDADGQADLMIQLDANGDVVGQARFDETSGDWVHLEDRAV